MKVYSLQSSKQRNIYGFTPDAKGTNLPAALAPWNKHGQHDVKIGEPPRIGVRTEDILAGIERDGFYLAGVSIRVTMVDPRTGKPL